MESGWRAWQNLVFVSHPSFFFYVFILQQLPEINNTVFHRVDILAIFL
jgi:hypothetical protein